MSLMLGRTRYPMFDFDVGKLMVVAIVALAVIPPKDLPRVMRTVGQIVGKMRRMAAEFQGQFMDAMREADFDSVRRRSTAINDKASRYGLRSRRHDPGRRDQGGRRDRPKSSDFTEIALAEPRGPTPRQEAAASRAPDPVEPQPRRTSRRRSRAPRNEPGGHRRHEGAVDGPSDRAAGAAHPGALRFFRRLPRLLLFLAARSTTS